MANYSVRPSTSPSWSVYDGETELVGQVLTEYQANAIVKALQNAIAPSVPTPTPTPVPEPTPTPTPLPSGQLILRNADDETQIAVLQDGQSYDIATLSVNVEAIPGAGVSAESCKFTLDGVHQRTESSKPFSLFGDSAGDYYVGKLASGS